MKVCERVRPSALSGAVLALFATSADAGVITGINQFLLPGFSTGSLSISLAVEPNNDNVTAPSANTVATGGFGVFLNAGGFGISDYEFNVNDSGGTTEYFFQTNVINNTGIAWTDYHFLLGFGTAAGFVPAVIGTGLDFDTPDRDPAPSSTIFPVLSHQPNVIDWSGATVNYLGGGASAPFSVAFSLSFDVPDGLAALHPEGVNRFTLRSMPTAQQVPEPATLGLIGLGLVCVALRRRRN